jgi:glycosyltransferase involved in cell wall biosynthesis
LVLLDTQAHIDFFIKEFGLPREKFEKIWIGADDSIFYPPETAYKDNKIFTVLFFGTFIPLQGVEYIIRAARILEKEDIVFNLVGRGQERQKAISLARSLELKNVSFRDMMIPRDLKNEIIKSDLCLGIFGDTPKTSLVIPNKVYEALAMRKPVITADTAAIRELFNDDNMFLVKTADPKSLAEGIMRLRNDQALRRKIAQNGFAKFIKFASTRVLGRELVKVISRLT